MGLKSFFRKIFVGEEDKDELELDAARARHGIKVDKKEMDKATTDRDRAAANYDVWEDLENFRSNWIFGAWINKKFHPIGEDKVKKELEELEKKHQKEAEQALRDEEADAEREMEEKGEGKDEH
ncbi:MAG: hypothetical protein ABR886_07775 [Dehalococcoidales bacterium]|jgi:hypothetical protein